MRNCFEAVINAQASRLATQPEIDAQALSVLEAADLLSPADADCEKHRKSGKGYIVTCEHCNEVYSWDTEMDITTAECQRCKKTYDCEFGSPA